MFNGTEQNGWIFSTRTVNRIRFSANRKIGARANRFSGDKIKLPNSCSNYGASSWWNMIKYRHQSWTEPYAVYNGDSECNRNLRDDLTWATCVFRCASISSGDIVAFVKFRSISKWCLCSREHSTHLLHLFQAHLWVSSLSLSLLISCACCRKIFVAFVGRLIFNVFSLNSIIVWLNWWTERNHEFTYVRRKCSRW